MELKPTAKGARTAALQVASSDADENPFDMPVSGGGAAKQAFTGGDEAGSRTDLG